MKLQILRTIPRKILQHWIDHYTPPYKINSVYNIDSDNSLDAQNIIIVGYEKTSGLYRVEFRIFIGIPFGIGNTAQYPKTIATEFLSAQDLESLIPIPLPLTFWLKRKK